MKFILVMNTPAGGDYQIMSWPKKDIEADLKASNVTFKGDIIDTPVCRMAVCLDSEGNSILLHQLKPKA